jgi:hypothetical protein
MSLKAADGSINVTVTDGSTWTGRYAANGSMYVVQANGSAYTGVNHKSGGVNVFISTVTGVNAPCGALAISVSPYVEGTIKVTPVSGSFV